MNNSIRQQIQLAMGRIVNNDALLEAELLLAKVLDKPRSYLYTWPEKELSSNEIKQYSDLLDERLSGKPMAYILGSQEFWSLEFAVTSNTLIPRPETEILVEAVLTNNLARKKLHVLDAGTGSGAIAITLAVERPDWTISACDISDAALQVAKSNAMRHKRTVCFFQNDWLENIEACRFDAIVSNPPYIMEGDEHLLALSFEPQGALIAKDNGLADIKKIVRQARHTLKPEGQLYIEHGYNQAELVRECFHQNGFINIATSKDFSNNDRFTYGVKI